jgi:S1-C subfamily serine protease
MVASDEFKIIASEQLRACGYDVLGGDNLLFGDDRSSRAEYQLGGTATGMTYDTYAPLAGDCTDASLTVEWQLYDSLMKEVVLTQTTEGYARRSGVSGAAMQGAFGAALNELMARQAFVDVVSRRPSESWRSLAANMDTLAVTMCDRLPATFLPEDIDDVLDGTLVIRAGSAVGSGVVISPDGYALTAAHVVSGLRDVVVQLRSGLELSADVLRMDQAQDVALIKLPGRGHSCVSPATGLEPGVGQDIFAVGAPTGQDLAFSVSKGVVSARRELDGFSYLQTDASLNPGNSGGPVVDVTGQLLGVVSWKVAAPGFEGLSFCVPTAAICQRLALTWLEE